VWPSVGPIGVAVGAAIGNRFICFLLGLLFFYLTIYRGDDTPVFVLGFQQVGEFSRGRDLGRDRGRFS